MYFLTPGPLNTIPVVVSSWWFVHPTCWNTAASVRERPAFTIDGSHSVTPATTRLKALVVHEPLNRTYEVFSRSCPRLPRASEHKGHHVPRIVDERQGERHMGLIGSRRLAIGGG